MAATGTAIQWYNQASGGTVYGSSTALINSTHYYASQTVAACESSARFDVMVTVNNCVSSAVWNGLTDSDWNTNGNWVGNRPPFSDEDVLIRKTDGVNVYNQPIINSGKTGVCMNITLNPGASLTIDGTLNVGGNLTLLSDLTSSTQLPGAILDNGTLNVEGTTTLNRNFKFTGANWYCFLTSPLKVTSPDNIATLQQLDDDVPLVNLSPNVWYNPDVALPVSKFPNIWKVDEAHTHLAQEDRNCWKVPDSKTESMTPMKGYALVVPSSRNIDFISTISGNAFNNENLSIPITRSPESTDTYHDNVKIDFRGATDLINGFAYTKEQGGNGWNLVGNPYPCPIDWEVVMAKPTGDIGVYAYFFVQSGPYNTGTWGYYNGFTGANSPEWVSQYIPSTQAFYINVIKKGPPVNLTFPASSRTVSNDAMTMYKEYFKSSKGDSRYPLIRLSVSSSNTINKKDETLIYFIPDANDIFDNKYDAYKILNTDPEYPNVYSLAGDIRLAANALPELKENLIIPIGVEVYTSGKYIITSDKLNNIPAGVTVYLLDSKKGVLQNLNSNPSYSFDINVDDDANRFFLKFTSQQSGISNQQAAGELFDAYTNNNILYVNYLSSEERRGKSEEAVLSIYNSLGQNVKELRIENGELRINLGVAPGAYFVRLVTKENVYVKKVYIQ